MKLYSYAERPELLGRRDELGAVWDEFMYHDAVSDVHWNRQYEEFPDLQLFLLDEGDRRVDQGDLAFRLPGGERAYLRCTLKDMAVGELKLMLDRYVHNSRIATETVVITARRPERYRSYLEGEFITAVRLIPPSIYDPLDA